MQTNPVRVKLLNKHIAITKALDKLEEALVRSVVMDELIKLNQQLRVSVDPKALSTNEKADIEIIIVRDTTTIAITHKDEIVKDKLVRRLYDYLFREYVAAKRKED